MQRLGYIVILLALVGGFSTALANTAPYFTEEVGDTILTEDVYWSAWLMATDDDGDPLTYGFDNDVPDGMTINTNTGRITWTPDNDDVGIHRIIASATDGSLTAYMEFFLHVQNINDPPVWLHVTEDTVSVSEDSEIDITVNANDDDIPHGDNITYSIIRGDNVSINSVTGAISGSPDNGNVGYQTVTVRARDDSSAAIEWSFVLETINTPVEFTNSPPTEVNEDEAYGFDISSNDEGQGGTLYYLESRYPEWLQFDQNTGYISGMPDNRYVKTETIQVIVDDNNGATDTLTYDLTVVNRKPVITTPALHNATEDVAFWLDVHADDEGYGETSYRFIDDLDWLTDLTTDGGVVSGTPTNAAVGSNYFTLEFDDGNGGRDTAEFVINVANSPVVIDTSGLIYDTPEDSEYNYQFTSSDDDQGSVTYHGINLPEWLAINLNSGVLRGTPTNEDVGDYNLSVYVSDGTDSDTVDFTIHVENRLPSDLTTPVTSAGEDSDYYYDITCDDEGEGAVYSWQPNVHPHWLSLDPATGELTGTPVNSAVGDTVVAIVINDGKGGEVWQEFIVTVGNRNPVFTPQADTTVTQYELLTIDLDTDDEGDPQVAYEILEALDGTEISPNDGIFSWTPTNAQVGIHAVRISGTDNHGGASTFDFSVTVLNSIPVISSSPPLTATEDANYYYDVQCNEEGDGDVSYSLTTAPDWLSINAATGVIQGTPGNPDVGDNSVTVKVNDGNGGIDTQSWTITVTNTNPTILTGALDPATEDSVYSFQIDYIPANQGDHTFSIVGDKPGWLNINALNGLLSGIPTNSQVGADSILIRISDDHGGLDEKKFEMVVNNSLAVFTTTDDITIAEDEALSRDINTNDEGDEGPNASGYNLVTAPDWMSINSTSGVISGTPRDDEVGTFPVTIRYQDGNGGKPELSVSVIITNDPPAFTSLSPTSTATEDSGYSFQFTSDDDAYGLTNYTPLNDILINNFTLTSAGLLSGTPSNNEVGNQDIGIVVIDGNNGKDTLEYTLTIANAESPITSYAIATSPYSQTDDTVYVTEDLPYLVDFTAQDEAVGGPASYTVNHKPAWMTVKSLVNGQLEGTPDNRHVGRDYVDITFSDGNGYSDTKRVYFEVENVISAFIDPPGTVTATEDVEFTLDLNSADEGQGTITYSVTAGNPGWFTLNAETGELAGTPDNGDVTEGTGVTFQVTDGNGGTATKTIVFIVDNVNDTPTWTFAPTAGSTISTAEDTSYSVDIDADDVDVGDNLTYSLTTNPTGMLINGTTGVINWTPDNSQVGDHAVAVRAVDDNAAAITRSWTVRVTNVASPIATPVVGDFDPADAVSASADTFYIKEDTTYTLDLTAPDEGIGAAEDVLYGFGGFANPDWITLSNSQTGIIAIEPTNSDVGLDSFKVFFKDQPGSRDTITVYFRVENVAPEILTAGPFTATEGENFLDTLESSDDGDGTITWSFVSGKPGWMDIEAGSAKISGTPENNDVINDASFTVQVTDGNGGATQKSFDYSVQNINTAPYITAVPDGTVDINEDELYTTDVNAADADAGDVISYSLTSKPSGMSINSSSGLIQWTPTNDQVETHTITVKAGDTEGEFVTSSWQLRVNNLNDAPTWVFVPDGTIDADEDALYTVTVEADDIDAGDNLTYSLTESPAGMTIDGSSGVIEWTPDNGDVGLHDITVRVIDDSSEAITASWTLNVQNINDDPIWSPVPPGTASSAEDAAYSVDVNASDSDAGDIISYSLTQYPAGMTINSSSGVISWTPDNSGVGSHSISVKATDLSGGFVTHTYTLQITNVASPVALPVPGDFDPADAVSATVDTFYIKEDTSYTLDLSAPDEGVGASSIYSFNDFSNPDWIALTNTADGTVSLTPTNSDVGLDSFRVYFKDQPGSRDTITVFLRVENVAPEILTAGPFSATEGVAFSQQLESSDDDDGTITWSFVSGKPGWLDIDTNTGLLSGTPDDADVISDGAFTVKVDDGNSGVTQKEFSYSVANANNDPYWTSVPSGTISTDEDALYSEMISAGDDDLDNGDEISYALVNPPAGMTINSSTGEIRWTPTNADVGSHPISIVANDLNGGSVSAAYTLQVSNVGSPMAVLTTADFSPEAAVTATADTFYIKEDTIYTVDLSSPDEGVGAASMYSFDDFANPDWIALTNTADGTVSLTPTNSDVGLDSFRVYFKDQPGSRDTITVFLRVENVAPEILTAGPFSATEGVAFSQQLESSDDDDGTITWSFVSGKPGWLDIDANTGLLSGTPDDADVISDGAFTVKVDDGNSGVTQKEFSYSVANANNDPYWTSVPSGTISTDEDALYSEMISAGDDDLDNGDEISYALVNPPAGMTINSSSGVISWIPDNADVRSHTITVKAEDTAGSSPITANYTLTVQNVDPSIDALAPGDFTPVGTVTATVDTFFIYEDSTYTADFSADDEGQGDGAVYRISRLSNPDWLSLENSTDGTVLLEPINKDVGLDSIRIIFDDGNATDTAQVFIRTQNSIPRMISAGPFSATEDAAFDVDLESTDEDAFSTYTFVGIYPGWMSINASNGLITGTPDNDAVGTSTFTVRINDGNGGTDDQLYTINVVNTNDPPIITSSAITAATEDLLYLYDLDAADQDGDPIVYSLDTAPDSMTIDPGTGVIRWTPDNNYGGATVSVIATVEDSTGYSVEHAWNITVVNATPNFLTADPSFNATEDVEFSVDLEVDDEGEGISNYAVIHLPDWMTLQNSASGFIGGTPDNSYVNSSDSVFMEFLDGNGGKDTLNVAVTVANVVPVFTAQGDTSVLEGNPILIDLDCDDEFAGGVTYTAQDPLPDWLSLNASTGELTGTPDNSDIGLATISIRATDDHSGFAMFSFQITVENKRPEFTGSPLTAIEEDSLYEYTLTIADDAGTNTFSIITNPGWLTVNSSTGTLSGTPLNQHVGDNTVSVKVDDGLGASDTLDFVISVANTAPVMTTIPPAAGTEDLLYAVDIHCSDEGQGTMIYTALQKPVWLSLNPNSGLLRGTPLNQHVSSGDSIEIMVNDGNGGFDTLRYSVAIANRGPSFTQIISDTTITEDDLFAFDINSDDEGQGATNYSFLNEVPDWIALDAESGELAGTPLNQHVAGSVGMNVKVDDGNGGSRSQIFTITVLNNPVRFISAITDSIATQDELFSYDADTDDEAQGDGVYTFTGLPAWLKGDDTTGVLTGTPDNDDVDTAAITIRFNDGNGSIAEQRIHVIVENANDAPWLTATAKQDTIYEDSLWTFQFFAQDIDSVYGDTLSFELQAFPSAMQIDSGSGIVSWTPQNDAVGDVGFELWVFDKARASDSLEFRLHIKNTNDAPVIIAQADTIAREDELFSYAVRYADVDVGDSLWFELHSSPLLMEIDSISGEITWTPTNDDREQSFEIIYSVTDSSGETDLDTFNVFVENVNDAPVLAALDEYTFSEDSSLSIQLSDWFDRVTDIDDPDSALSWQVNSFTALNAVINNDSLSISGPSNWFGPDTGEVVVSDGELSDTTQLIVFVPPVNDSPVIAAEFPALISFDEDDSTTLNLNDYVSDVDNGDLELNWSVEPVEAEKSAGNVALSKSESAKKTRSIKAYSVNSKRSLLVNSNGDSISIDIDPVTNIAKFYAQPNFFVDGFDFRFIVNDSTDGADYACDSVMTTIRVEAVNDAPVLATLPELIVAEDSTITVVLSDWFEFVSDVDNHDTTLTWDIEAGDAVSGIISDSLLLITPPDNWFGNDTLSIIAHDENLLADTAEVIVHFQPVNDAPVFNPIPDISFPEDDTFFVHLNDYAADIETSDDDLVFDFFRVESSGSEGASQGAWRQKSVLEIAEMNSKSRRNVLQGNSPAADSIIIEIHPGTHIAAITGAPNYFTSARPFGFTVSDGEATDTGMVSIAIEPVNDKPVLDSLPPVVFVEDSVFTLSLAEWDSLVCDVEDPDDSLRWAFSTPGLVQVRYDSLLRQLALWGPENFHGSDVLSTIVTDRDGLSDTVTVAVTILPFNDPPQIDSSLFVITFDQKDTVEFRLDAYVSDRDHDAQAMRWEFNAGEFVWFDYTDTSRTVKFWSDPDLFGVDSLLAIATDPLGGADSQYLKITVTDTTEPTFELAIFQNQLASRFVEIDVFPSELMADRVLIITDGDTLPVLQDLDADSIIYYNATYQIEKTGIIQIQIAGSDLAGNPGEYAYQIGVSRISRETGGSLTDPDSIMSFLFAAEAVPMDLCALFIPYKAAIRPDTALAKGMFGDADFPVSDEFDFRIPVASLADNARIMFNLEKMQFLQQYAAYLGIYRLENGEWQYLKTYTSLEKGSYWAYTKKPGVYQIRVNSANPAVILPEQFSVRQNYPNPFNSQTTICYTIGAGGFVTFEEAFEELVAYDVSIKIYNLLGQEVTTLLNKPQLPGHYSITWNGRNNYGKTVATGFYIYQVIIGNKVFHKKMTVLK